MTGSSHSNIPIEDRLDDLLDQLSLDGDTATAASTDLRELSSIAKAIRNTDELKWPENDYPAQLAANLYAELGFDRSGGSVMSPEHEPWNRTAEGFPSAISQVSQRQAGRSSTATVSL
ncbi:MAG: hypothetical protein R3A46_16190 [Thermomicrobiales bacterium]